MTDESTPAVVIRKRRGLKQLRLTVRDDGSARLTIPWSVSFAVARKFLEGQKQWIAEAYQRVLARPPRLLTEGGVEEYRATKEAARERITERVTVYAARYGVTYRSISIRNQKSRFGSCSARGHLSFNYRLIFLPPHLLDYVVAHEVCHLRELNHSRRFWTLLAETIPDYQAKKHELQAFSRTAS